MSFAQKKSQKLNEFLDENISDYFYVGIDPDGNRMYGVKMDLK